MQLAKLEKPQKGQKDSITLEVKYKARGSLRKWPKKKGSEHKQLETGQGPLTLKTSYTLPQPEED